MLVSVPISTKSFFPSPILCVFFSVYPVILPTAEVRYLIQTEVKSAVFNSLFALYKLSKDIPNAFRLLFIYLGKSLKCLFKVLVNDSCNFKSFFQICFNYLF